MKNVDRVAYNVLDQSTLFQLFISECKVKADVAFIIDSSSAVSRAEWKKIKSFVEYITEKLDVDNGQSRVAIISYGDRSKVNLHLSDSGSRESVLASLATVRYAGTPPYTADALEVS